MNKPNNKRRKESQKKIEKVFLNLIQTKEIKEITVTEICKLAKINRSTFYANYLDVYDLSDKIIEKFENNVYHLYRKERETKNNTNDYLKLFKHVKDNQIFYKTYFKLGRDKHFVITEYDTNLAKKFYDDKYIDYHIEFFMSGLNAIVKKWLDNGCKESPEEINNVLITEYKRKDFYK